MFPAVPLPTHNEETKIKQEQYKFKLLYVFTLWLMSLTALLWLPWNNTAVHFTLLHRWALLKSVEFAGEASVIYLFRSRMGFSHGPTFSQYRMIMLFYFCVILHFLPSVSHSILNETLCTFISHENNQIP